MATVKSFKADISSVNPLSFTQNFNFETLYIGQFTLSTQLIILNYLLYTVTDTAPQILWRLTPLFNESY